MHEKSILLPLLPVTLLAGYLPATCLWLMPAALVSMYPLLERDGLLLPYAAMLLLWCGAVWPWGEEVRLQRCGAERGCMYLGGVIGGRIRGSSGVGLSRAACTQGASLGGGGEAAVM